MSRALQWGAGVALIAAAWVVLAIAPPTDSREAPFPVTIAVGETGVARTFEVTVDGVRRARAATDGAWSAEANWLVADLTAVATQRETGMSLFTIALDVDGDTYTASERPASFREAWLAVGIPRSGSVAFELPDDVDGGIATLRIAQRVDTRLDSVVETRIDLGSLPVDDETALRPSGWATP
ncbi:hypothetical protein [Microbacterium sp. No. 7]|uniref:hypothetical protein n=1 Tax=Microbacterium sp. No. 7 TaxID=1714373 RepID=UPI0006CF9CFD|nr:hypothetical protein [Microbacterium sp. No. 7]ALJ20026.1 hypothetical protein AOA12_08935 [Microbacterium sp. No. 7]